MLFQDFRGREEIVAEVERDRGAVDYQPYPVLRGYVGEAGGGISPAGEHDPFDFRADRRERGTDIIAAIEQGGEACLGNRLARRGDKRPEPTGTHIATGTGRAGKHDPTTGSRSGSQSRNCVAEGVDNDDESVPVTRLLRIARNDTGGCHCGAQRDEAIPVGKDSGLSEPPKIGGNLDHSVRKSPLVVVPGEDPHKAFVENLRLGHVEGRAVRVVVEID